MVRVSAVNELAALSRTGSDEGPGVGSPGAGVVRRVVITGDPFNSKVPGVYMGGSIMLQEPRRVRERRLRPQAGCMYSEPHSTR
jgi:hypothetical protein